MTNRRPSCEEAAHAAPGGAGEPLVQIGLPTGTRSTGFDATRRDVLSLMGFSLGALGVSGCRAPVQHAVPLPTASVEMVPGVPNLYATTCGGCSAACALVVKQRDGRPIKIEGNESSPLTGGGTCAAGQASVLSLYDDARLRGPSWLGNPVSWPEMDRHIRTALGSHSDAREVVLLSPTITSPSTRAVLEDLRAVFPKFRHVVYDPMSLASLRAANRLCHGAAVIPHYRFDRARVVVGKVLIRGERHQRQQEMAVLGDAVAQFPFADEHELVLGPAVEVLDLDRRADRDGIQLHLLGVEDLRERDLGLELADHRVELPHLLARGVELGVFREVAHLAGFAQRLLDAGHLDVLEVIELLLRLLVPLRGHRDAIHRAPSLASRVGPCNIGISNPVPGSGGIRFRR